LTCCTVFFAAEIADLDERLEQCEAKQ
jgi:hypothetical protein